MTFGNSRRCPQCHRTDLFAFDRRPTGCWYYCAFCHKHLRVTIEDETLDMIGAALAERRPGRSSGNDQTA